VWIFGRKSRTHRTLGSHQIRVFHRWLEQLVGREARRELNEALAHVLGVEASPEAPLTVDKHRSSRLTIIGLRCHSSPIKVSINMFPLSLWSHRRKLELQRAAALGHDAPLRAWAGATPGRSQPPQPSDQHRVTLVSAVKRRWQLSVRLDLNTRAEIPIWFVQSKSSIWKPTAGV
jgi:hypothetical protein